MAGKRSVGLLIAIMAIVATAVACVTIYALYNAAFGEECERLTESAQSRARLFEAILRHEEQEIGALGFADHEDAVTVALEQVRASHQQFKGFGETGEFTMGMLEDGQIVFLVSHRHDDLDNPKPVPLSLGIAEPMRRALSGESGTVVDKDYRGEIVLAAHEPVAGGKFGVVAKIDLQEIRAPFLKAGAMAGLVGLVFVSLGTLLFLRIGGAMVERLEESEAKYRGLFESATDMLFLTDLRGVILDVNPAACSAYGYTKRELIGQTVDSVAHPDSRERVTTALKELATSTTVKIESTDVRRDGRRMDVEAKLSRLRYNGRTVVLSDVRDVSESKRSNEMLRQRTHDLAERVKELNCLYGVSRLAATPDISLQRMLEGTVRIIPPAWRYPEITAVRITVDGHTHQTKDFKHTDWTLVREITVDGQPVGAMEVCYLEERPPAAEGPFLEEESALIGAISERLSAFAKSHKTETELHRERDNLRQIFESMDDGVWIGNRDHEIVYVNPAFGQAFGPWKGRKCHEYFNGADSPCLECRAADVFAGKTVRREWVSSKTGKTYDVIDTPLTSSGGEILQLEICRDFTERKHFERELERLNDTLEQRVAARTADAEKRAAQLRTLAAALTQTEQRERRRLAEYLHDHLQQLLYGMRLQLGGFKKEESRSRQVRQAVRRIDALLDESMEALRTLTSELYPPILRTGGIGPVLAWLVGWVREQHGLQIDLEVDPAADRIPEDVLVVLYRAVRELLFNVVKHGETDRARVRVSRLGADQIRIVVSDRGRGFDLTESRVAEANGGGFGLRNIHERIEAVGGQMTIESAPDRGTRSVLIVPTHPAPPSDDGPRSISAEVSRESGQDSWVS